MNQPELFDSIAARLATGLTPVRPIRPARMAAALAAAFAVSAALGLALFGAHAPHALTPLQLAGTLAALSLTAAALIASSIRQAIPGSLHRISPLLLTIGLPAALAILIALLFHCAPEHRFLPRAWNCFRSGLPFAALTALAVWFTLRRGCTLAPRLAGATAGLLAGLAGTAMLSLHCPDTNAFHVLTGHLGVALAGAAVGSACWPAHRTTS